MNLAPWRLALNGVGVHPAGSTGKREVVSSQFWVKAESNNVGDSDPPSEWFLNRQQFVRSWALRPKMRLPQLEVLK